MIRSIAAALAAFALVSFAAQADEKAAPTVEKKEEPKKVEKKAEVKAEKPAPKVEEKKVETK